MFQIIKEKTNIVEVLEKEIKIPFKKIGDSTYAPEDETCPFCGHRDCFRIKDTGENGGFYHCFSCEEHGDVISFISKLREVKPRDAALALAREWKIAIPNDYSPIQDIFNLSALYYYTCMRESCNKPYPELNKLTPLEFQTQVRRHKQESLDHFKIGWSDGGLVTYLRGLGFEDELLFQTGLVNRKGLDFFPARVFIYPHFINGRVSHFTFKDPLKIKEYQLKNTNKLNNHTFYNSDSIRNKEVIIIVEGENDLISVYEAGWEHGLIATIGQISSAQLEWVETILAGKNIITIFDTDQAGDKYREKITKLKSHFKSLTQIKLTSGLKDIDEYLVNGGNLDAALTMNVSPTKEDIQLQPEIEEEASPQAVNIIEQKGAYYRIRYKEGNTVMTKLTNFTIKLRNVFIDDNQNREREVVLSREDGAVSPPIKVNSDCKVSLKSFKAFVANAIDGSYYGAESDLTAMWEYVYSQGTERIVYVPLRVGRIDEFKGWLFRDSFITDTGIVIDPDEEGIIWLNNKATGIKPISLDIEMNGKSTESIDIPILESDKGPEEREELLETLIENLCRNLGDVGQAFTLLGWAQANVYSDFMFTRVKGFPFLFLWGRHGGGKTVIAKWISALFNMEESGYATLPQFKSGVGFGRKIAYYSSLPVIVDEVRADKDTAEQYGVIRGWYQRAGRTLGTKEGFGIKQQRIRSNFIFVGQDQFTDSATKQRCVPVRIAPNAKRETVISFNWIERHRGELSSIGYHWILESSRVSLKEIESSWSELDKILLANKCEPRTAKNWACVGVFAKALCDKYMPKFNYLEYLIKVSHDEAVNGGEDDIIHRFFSIVEGMQASDNSPFNMEHFKKEGNKIYIWLNEVFRLVNETRRSGREEFSENAILAALKEEPYFLEASRKYMGMNKTRRSVVVLDLDNAIDSIKNIGNTCG